MMNAWKRKRHRRSKRKRDPIVTVLSVIAVMLLFVWGGFYANDKIAGGTGSGGSGTAAAGTQETPADPDSLPGGQDSAAAQGGAEATPASAPEVTPEPSAPPVSGSTAAPQEPPGKPQLQSVKPPAQLPGKTQSKPGHQTASPAAPQPSPSAVPPASAPPSAGPSQPPAATDNGSGSVSNSGGNSGSNEAGSDDAEGQYEQQLIEVQAMCSSSAETILSKGEQAISELQNSGDLDAAKVKQQQLVQEMEEAGQTCKDRFQAVVDQAKSDSVADESIAAWEQTYDILEEQFRSRAEELGNM
ncbi:hypothetical protein [Paenibacillus protaetiae]|uniref:Uncharacterized protein n=1 Tax=Paenibacillus protaetiae TaxID=2509456 RepID=A0A4P6EY76_9BACL|nr:hypothetical protein [Paenibacillus protaetiae]QAY67203.1 hypothetical protein ET464_13140 [Paenibacillus protaetiae]